MALNMNRYPDWLISSTPSIQPSLESPTSVLSYDTSADGQETDRYTTTKTPTSKKPIVELPYIKGMSEQIMRVFKQYDIKAYFKPVHTLHQLLVRQKDQILKERVFGPVYHIHVIHVLPLI